MIPDKSVQILCLNAMTEREARYPGEKRRSITLLVVLLTGQPYSRVTSSITGILHHLQIAKKGREERIVTKLVNGRLKQNSHTVLVVLSNWTEHKIQLTIHELVNQILHTAVPW